jgi:hypothetical protein
VSQHKPGDTLLAGLDIQPRPFRAFLWALITMDLRSFHYGKSTGVGANATFSPLFWVVGQFLTASLLLSMFLFARVDVYFFALAGLSSAALCLVSAVVVEFNEAALDPRDRSVIGHRPLTPRTYAAARMGNFLFYVALLGLALTVFPAVIGAFLRDAGPAYLFAYGWASLLAVLTSASLVILLLTTVGADASLESAQSVLAWTQIGLILVVFYGAQLVIRKGTSGVALFAADPPDWIVWLPPHWLARGVEVAASEGLSLRLLGWAGLATLGVLTLLFLAIFQLSRAYTNLNTAGSAWRRVHLPRPTVAGSVGGGWLTRLFTRGRAEAVGFWLTRTHFARDAELKMRSYPLFVMAIAGVFLAIATDNCTDPFRVHANTSVLPIAVIALLASAVPPVVQNVSFTRDPGAAWLLESAPLLDTARLVAGVRKALAVGLFYPALGLLFLSLAWAWQDPLGAGLHTLVAWLVVEGALRWSMAEVLRGYPFREEMIRGATMGSVALASGLVTGAAATLGIAHFFAAQSGAAMAVYVAGLASIVLGLDAWSARRVRALTAKVRRG